MPVNPSLSSTSIGNSTGLPPGTYTGKVKLPIKTRAQSYSAHAANLAAGNPIQPAQVGVPQHILAPPTGQPSNPGSRLLDQMSPPSPEARAGRHVNSVADSFDRNSGDIGRNFVGDMSTPGRFVPVPGQPGSFAQPKYLPAQTGGMTKTQSALEFGAKLASDYVDLYNKPKKQEKEKEEKKSMATQSISALEFGAKLAKSMCSPCDMPNSPTNKKHMTSASPAVLEADEKSEEIKPETEKTEHTEQAIDVPGQKASAVSACFDFGRRFAKAAVFGEMPSGTYAARPELKYDLAKDIINSDIADSAKPAPAAAPAAPAPAAVQGPQDIALPPRSYLGALLGHAPTPAAGSVDHIVQKTLAGQRAGRANAVANAWANQGAGREGTDAWTGVQRKDPLAASMRLGKTPLGRILNTVAALPDAPAAKTEAAPATGTYNDAVNVAKTDVTGTNLGAHVDSVVPKVDAKATGDMLGGYGKYLPYAAGGLGAAGLAALAYQLMSQKKKKKNDGTDEE